MAEDKPATTKMSHMGKVAKGYLVEGEVIHWQGKPATIVIIGKGLVLALAGLAYTLALLMGDGSWVAYGVALAACLVMMPVDRRYGLAIGVVGLAILAMAYFLSEDWMVWVELIPLACALLYLLANIIYLGRVLFVITDQRIITRYGILSLRYAELDIDRIQNVTVMQPWYERLLGYGDVVFATAGEKGGIDYQKPGVKLMSGGAVIWEDVSKPFEVVRKVNEIIHSLEKIRMERGGAVPQAGVADAEARLMQLSELSAKGLISQQEYQQKREEILRRL